MQRGLLARDWKSVQRTLTALGTPLLLVRGDVNANFREKHITPPAALERAMSDDPGMRLVRRFGKLVLFALRAPTNPTGSVTSYATVNSATPDLRDLSLLPAGTPLISGPMRQAVPAVLQVPPFHNGGSSATNSGPLSLNRPVGGTRSSGCRPPAHYRRVPPRSPVGSGRDRQVARAVRSSASTSGDWSCLGASSSAHARVPHRGAR